MECVERPWGRFEVVAEGPGWKTKVLFVAPMAKLSLQRHERRSEQWYVVSGEGRIEIDGETTAAVPGARATIPAGRRHRLVNADGRELVVVEVQTGDCDETDIVRLDDDYGRC